MRRDPVYKVKLSRVEEPPEAPADLGINGALQLPEAQPDDAEVAAAEFLNMLGTGLETVGAGAAPPAPATAEPAPAPRPAAGRGRGRGMYRDGYHSRSRSPGQHRRRHSRSRSRSLARDRRHSVGSDLRAQRATSRRHSPSSGPRFDDLTDWW